jgi:hypothetical protein
MNIGSYHAIHSERELAYQGDPDTGEPTDGFAHQHHIRHVDNVAALIANQDEAGNIFLRWFQEFLKVQDLFDGFFVLEVDLDTGHIQEPADPALNRESTLCGRRSGSRAESDIPWPYRSGISGSSVGACAPPSRSVTLPVT